MAIGFNLDRMMDRQNDMAETKIVMGPIVKEEVATRKSQRIMETLGGSYADLKERGLVKSIQEYMDLYNEIGGNYSS